jgi:hypothetical protein
MQAPTRCIGPTGKAFMVGSIKRVAEKLFCVRKGDVGAEADHANAGGGPLTAAKSGAGFEFAFEGSGEGDGEQVGRGVEGNGEDAKRRELEEGVAAFGCDELRDEGEEEERGLGIECFGENALAEGVAGWGSRLCGKLGVARADHFYAEEDEIGGASILDGVERDCGRGEDCGDSEGGGEDVEESAEESTDGRLKAFAAAPGESASEYVEDAGARGDGEEKRGGEEEQETVRVKHRESIRV